MIFLTIPLLLLAATFDSEMTKQEQKVTGIHKLSKKERKALQSWIDDHYLTQQQGTSIPRSAKPQKLPLVEENLQNGRYIRLTDQTIWEIHPADTSITQGWLGPAEILITQTTDSEYPNQLTNQLSGTSVRARRINKVPLPSKQQTPSRSVTSPPGQGAPVQKTQSKP